MRQLLICIGSAMLLTACVQQHQPPATTQAFAQKSLPSQKKLYGAWTSQKIEASNSEWLAFETYQLFVYEDKVLHPVRPNLPGEPIVAELIGVKRDGKPQLVYDTQPVFATTNRLYFGPIGSCYHFGYELSDSNLKLELLSTDGGYLTLYFVRTADSPGRPRFPKQSER